MSRLTPSNLKQTFSISRYIQLKDEVQLPEKQTIRGQWVIGRSQCLYKAFNLSRTPKKHRAQALNLLIQRWSPFSSTASYTAWDQTLAMVWIWDNTNAQEKIAELGITVVEQIPESILYPKNQSSATCIVSIDGGFICQIWEKELLLAEKWLATPPNTDTWLQIIRGITLPSNSNISPDELHERLRTSSIHPEEIPLSARPWGNRNKVIPLLQTLKWEPWFFGASLTIVAAGILWNATAVAITLIAISNVETRIEIASKKLNPVLEARETAISINKNIKELLKAVDFPQQRALLANISKTMQDQNAELKEWAYSLDKLEIIVEGDKIQTLTLLQALEGLPFVISASLDKAPQNNQYKFILIIRTHHAR